MKRILIPMGVLLTVALLSQADEVYRWVDADGEAHYGDTPPAQAQSVETLKFPDAPPAEASLPYETRRAQQNFPVTLYVADNCAELCNRARDLLAQRGIPFSEQRLVTQEEIDAFKAASGSDSVPSIALGRTYIIGFLAERWHSELDIAGYPKSAPYRPLTLPAAASEVAPANPAVP